MAITRPTRSRRRGAIFVESIIVISFFTLCFLGVMYFRELYVAKIRVQRLARASAMAHAMGACKVDATAGLEKDLANAEPSQATDTTTPDSKPIPPMPPGKASDAVDLNRSESGPQLFKVTSVTLKTTASATTRRDDLSQKQGFQSDVASTSFVSCIDRVAEGGAEEIIPRVFRVFF